MRFSEFRDAIGSELHRHPRGWTWLELRQRLNLPYERPCPTWTRKLETEIRLVRVKEAGRAFIWKIQRRESEST